MSFQYSPPILKRKNYMGNYYSAAGLGAAAGVIQRAWRSRYRKPLVNLAARSLLGKRSRSGTLLQSQKPLHQHAEQDGSGGSFSEFHYGTYKLSIPRSVNKELAKNYTVSNFANRWQSSVGLQNAYLDLSMFTSADILGLPGITGSTKGRILLNGCRAEYLCTNAANTSVRMTFYDIISRKDLNSATVLNPAYAWKQGVDDEGGSGTNYQIPGCTPFNSKSFTEFFKIRKVTHVLLGQGATHIHRVKYFPNRAMDYGTLEYGSNWKGLTCYVMCVIHGQASNDATTKSQVSVGAADVNVVTSKEYETSFITDNTTSWVGTNSLPTSFTVGENTVSIGAGLVEAATNA